MVAPSPLPGSIIPSYPCRDLALLARDKVASPTATSVPSAPRSPIVTCRHRPPAIRLTPTNPSRFFLRGKQLRPSRAEPSCPTHLMAIHATFRRRHDSPRTREAYLRWIRSFLRLNAELPRGGHLGVDLPQERARRLPSGPSAPISPTARSPRGSPPSTCPAAPGRR
jgi:hypothetical protein